MRRLLLVSGIAAAWAAAAAGTQQAPKLAGRYRNILNGFSLCPPANTQLERTASARRLVGWVSRDEKTGAIRWSLDVLRTRPGPTELSAAEYAKAVAEELARTHQFKVDSTELAVVAGKPAMHFRGIWSGALRLWRRQSWVQVEPGNYLVLNIAGTEAAKAEMDAVLTAVLKTLELFDPEQARRERGQAVARGAEVLGKLTEAGLQNLLSGETFYFLMKLKGQPVGFLRGSESMASHEGRRGIWVVRLAALKLAKQPRQLIREELFASPDRRLERWRRTTLLGEGPAAVHNTDEAIKQDDLILLHSRSQGQPRKTRQFEVPEPVRPAYLPDAMGVVAPRLIDRSRPGSYGFAVFNPAALGFELRTIVVVGTETITHAGKKVLATHLTDQMADDAPQADLWVDHTGRLLSMTTAEELSIERSSRAAVVELFAAELLELEKLSSRPPAGEEKKAK